MMQNFGSTGNEIDLGDTKVARTTTDLRRDEDIKNIHNNKLISLDPE